MVTYLKTWPTAGGLYVEGFALSSDTLPVSGIVNGSRMEVLDTSAGTVSVYRFNQAGAAWVEVEEPSSSGGGSGGDSGFLTVHITEDNGTYTTDKTAGEIKTALVAGTPVFIPYNATDELGATIYAVAPISADGVFTFLEQNGKYGLSINTSFEESQRIFGASSLDDYMVYPYEFGD